MASADEGVDVVRPDAHVVVVLATQGQIVVDVEHAVAVAVLAAGCGGDNGSSSGPVTLTLITHDAFAYTKDVMAQWSTEPVKTMARG